MGELKKYIILGHENPDVDSIVSGYLLEKLLLSKSFNVEFIIPDKRIEKDTVRLCKEFGLDIEKLGYLKDLPTNKDYNYILVDHHDRITPGIITAVIDHHPTKTLLNIPWYQNVQSSSTTCLICRGNENYFNKSDIELAILASMVDTASFHSTKTCNSDVSWVKEMCQKYNIDYNRLYKKGLCLTDMSNIDEVKLNGLKKYNFEGNLVESSYIQIEEITNYSKKITYIIDSLMNYVKENNLKVFVFIVHDMKTFKTTVYNITANDYTVRYYNEYTSRGNNIIPEIEEELKKESNRRNLKVE